MITYIIISYIIQLGSITVNRITIYSLFAPIIVPYKLGIMMQKIIMNDNSQN